MDQQKSSPAYIQQLLLCLCSLVFCAAFFLFDPLKPWSLVTILGVICPLSILQRWGAPGSDGRLRGVLRVYRAALCLLAVTGLLNTWLEWVSFSLAWKILAAAFVPFIALHAVCVLRAMVAGRRTA